MAAGDPRLARAPKRADLLRGFGKPQLALPSCFDDFSGVTIPTVFEGRITPKNLLNTLNPKA